MSDEEDEGEDDMEHEIYHCNWKDELLIANEAEQAVVQQDPAFKKVDFKKVRHCFPDKSLTL